MAVKIIEGLLRVILGAIFVYAGVVKIWDTQQFAMDVQNYQLLPWTGSILVAIYLPWLEVFAGLALIVRRLYDGALLAILGMLTVFLGAIVSAWSRGLDITCGCFGKSDLPVSYPALLGRDLAMLAVAAALIWLRTRKSGSLRDAAQVASGREPSAA